MGESRQLGNLGAARSARAKARADERAKEADQAAREQLGETLPLFFEPGRVFATLHAELPLAAFAPLRTIDVDVAYLVRKVWDLATANTKDEEASRAVVVGTFLDLLMSNPDLPSTLIDAIVKIAQVLMTPEGYAGFLAEDPSVDDVREIVLTLWSWYGASLGKVVSSLPSSSDGETSNATSSASTESTPAEPGAAPETPDSSVSVDS